MTTKITVRVPDALHDALREEYAMTYPTHRMSWNSWISAKLEAARA